MTLQNECVCESVERLISAVMLVLDLIAVFRVRVFSS